MSEIIESIANTKILNGRYQITRWETSEKDVSTRNLVNIAQKKCDLERKKGSSIVPIVSVTEPD